MQINLEDLVVGNAAGTVKTLADVEKMCHSAATRVTLGSVTKEPREGNVGDTYYFDPTTSTSINALGLPNSGLKHYVENLIPLAHSLCERSGKELWVSVAGFSPDEFAEMAIACLLAGADGVELNTGCPNIHDKGEVKPIFSYHPELVEVILNHVVSARAVPRLSWKMIGIKISPVPTAILTDLCDAIARSGIVCEVTAINTEPNKQMRRADGSKALSFLPPGSTEKKDVGGLAGAPLLPETLRVVEKLCHLLPMGVKVIAVGGIFTGADALECLNRGAAGFQCATAYLEYGPKIFGDILAEI